MCHFIQIVLRKQASKTCRGLRLHCMLDKLAQFNQLIRLRPYHVENTGSRPITEVKQRRARLVLGWVTAWEYRVL